MSAITDGGHRSTDAADPKQSGLLPRPRLASPRRRDIPARRTADRRCHSRRVRGDQVGGGPSEVVCSTRAAGVSAGECRGQHNTVTAATNTISDVQSLSRRPRT